LASLSQVSIRGHGPALLFERRVLTGASSQPGGDGGAPVSVAIVGAGGAGLSLVIALERAARRAGVRAPSVVVIDPVRRPATDRTWCWWAGPGDESANALVPLAARVWSRMELRDRFGGPATYELGELRYVMLRSADFYAEAEAALTRLGDSAVWLTGAIDQVSDGPETALVQVVGQQPIAARWVFDSRPVPPHRPASTTLLQHFRGWTVRFDDPVLNPGLPMLMDFGVRQPDRGVAFGYCLPIDAHRGLVEYTEFSRRPLAPADYDRALTDYLRDRWGVLPGNGLSVEAVEDGVIPMTDAPFARQVGTRVFRWGTAGGATRPSTGYTFAAIQRQAVAVAELLLAGRVPVPPRPYPARHLWLDAVLLRALDRGYIQGPELFTGLFADNSSQRVVRFLDGLSSPRDELAIMRSTPMLPMLRATIEDGVARGRRRLARRR
jgi:lycopene beta-cyclase